MAVREIEWPRDVATLARSLSDAGTGGWFWLDGGAAGPDGELGLSYLGAAAEVRQARHGAEREFLEALRPAAHAPQAWVVALSYEFGVALMGEDPAVDNAPLAFALRANTVLVLDHARGVAELRGPDEAALDEWLVQQGAALAEQTGGAGEPTAPPAYLRNGSSPAEPRLRSASQSLLHESVRWRCSEADYLGSVEACKAAIHEGDAYVLCLTDTAELPAIEVDPLTLYQRLRADQPELRGAVIVAGGRALVSASPERFLSVRGARVSTHPIKGTRPRGDSAAEDAKFAADLAQDPKERAENLMIVDLMRNDLSRVCEPGTVAAERFLRVESHPRVHQLVSTVTGVLHAGVDVVDVIEACFPGGSMTGAPKRRAVQLLADFERGPRGLYSGCFGWIGGEREAELAMTIRSIELRDLGTSAATARIGAGGGITLDSSASAEFAEKQLKAAALLAALAGLKT